MPSAVETYNRASALYREETFAILMINAWKLLLKARIMRENGGKASSIDEFRQAQEEGRVGQQAEGGQADPFPR
ncbi:DUF3644 domain-containing protein [Sphingomonas sp. MMS24-JH45]